MVFCPNCQFEHSSATLTCPDCRESLLEKIDASKPVATIPDDSWSSVANIKGAKLAEKAKESLDANNIPSILMPKSFTGVSSVTNSTNQAMDVIVQSEESLLMVPREYKSEASLIVKNLLNKENAQHKKG